MRFFAITTLALASAALAAPTQKRSLLSGLGSVVSAVEDKLGITAIEDALDKALGGGLTKLEDTLGVSFAESLLKLSDSGAAPGDIQTVGKDIYFLEEGLGINAIDAFLDKETGGAISSIEKALGVTDLEKALGISA